jgi:hypothetical protein
MIYLGFGMKKSRIKEEDGNENVTTQLADSLSRVGSRYDDLYLRRSGTASVQHQAVSSEARQPVNQWKSFKECYFQCSTLG